MESLLPKLKLTELVRTWPQEDTPRFDYGGFVVGEKEETALLLCKSAGILCGVPFLNKIFEELQCSVKWNFEEGTDLVPVCICAVVRGKVKYMLLEKLTKQLK